MNIIYILNSDFGVQGTIGMRALPTAKLLYRNKHKLTIFCRDYKSNNFTNKIKIKKVIPFGSLPMKVINGIKLYLFKDLNVVDINTKLFEFFLIKKLSKIDLKKVKIIHCWDFLPKTFNYIKKKNPDIIIIKDMTMSFPNILKGIEKTEKYWKTISSKDNPLEINSIPFVDYYLHPAISTGKSLQNSGISKEKLLFIPYGVDYNKFKPIKKDFDGKFKVCFVGNVNYRKGFGYLIEAWKFLKLDNAELNIYGRINPEVSESLKDKDKYNILTHGFVDIKKQLPRNHLMVHPSLLESTPKTLNEALASGLPVITTSNSGPAFKDGIEGFVVREQSCKDIAEKINFFYYNRDELKKFSQRAREFASKRSWDDYGKDVFDSYYKIIRIKRENV